MVHSQGEPTQAGSSPFQLYSQNVKKNEFLLILLNLIFDITTLSSTFLCHSWNSDFIHKMILTSDLL